MKIAIVTDSTATITKEEAAQYGIKVIPIPIILDGKVYKEGQDLTTKQFYDMLKTSESFPSTSQPAIGELLEMYESLKADGYDQVLSIHLASTISGFVNNIKSIDDKIEGLEVIPYDSKITVRLMGWQVLKAAKMAQEGHSVADIIDVLDQLSASIDEYFVVDDLNNLVRGGRLSNAGAVIGTMLKVKPILTFDDESNYIVPFEKVRSMKKAQKRVEELFNQALLAADYPIIPLVIHGNDPVAGEKWRQELEEKYPELEFELSYFSPVIGTHLGQGALALAWMRDPESL
ncbi:DegV family protein [Weissella diestrammenae]|uniref:DegV family protein n=1 Tax=Weissella diestrammenae TaxID=1162633 RepID=A0A7G9T7Q6_9LACO|nr:DegV family protein [Weissella diestrammenae]MCM0582871.1 DegV family protein [Weissella diestrammenae]QNN76131.1 DegV family protein [Weissella diestrammenae]